MGDAMASHGDAKARPTRAFNKTGPCRDPARGLAMRDLWGMCGMTILKGLAVGLALLAASGPVAADDMRTDGFQTGEWRGLPRANGRADWTLGIGEVPFARGAMSVIAAEGGELRTWRLVPCRDGRAVCAWSINGTAGRVEIAPDAWRVSGIFGSRTFELWPGGGGAIRYANGVSAPLAWNAVE